MFKLALFSDGWKTSATYITTIVSKPSSALPRINYCLSLSDCGIALSFFKGNNSRSLNFYQISSISIMLSSGLPFSALKNNGVVLKLLTKLILHALSMKIF